MCKSEGVTKPDGEAKARIEAANAPVGSRSWALAAEDGFPAGELAVWTRRWRFVRRALRGVAVVGGVAASSRADPVS